ncbi:hypothetical protein ACWGJX_48215, partial [Streptomyces sp. NPDC054775]
MVPRDPRAPEDAFEGGLVSTNEVDASVRPAPSPPRGGIRAFAERWPFRRKLNVLVGVPLAVVAVLLAY